ncbi:MAG: tail fiber protein [Leptospiraceae bacterium]|nr:tail fiber protein [Leptospiraceae bacterium]
MDRSELVKFIETTVSERLDAEIRKRNRKRLLSLAVLALLIPAALWAATIVKQYTFTAGNPAVAAEVNANFDDLFTKVNLLDQNGPPGLIVAYGGATAPTGWFICNGTTVSRTTYAALFTAIGTTFGSGNGTTTFHLPDLRGRFLRGADQGAGVDVSAASRTAMNSGGNTGDNVGSVQADAFQGHWHYIHSGYRDVAAFSQALAPGNGAGTTPWPGGWATGNGGGNANTDASLGNTPANQNPGKFFATTETQNTTSGATGTNPGSTGGVDRDHGVPRTAAESRPKNASVNYIIKY